MKKLLNQIAIFIFIIIFSNTHYSLEIPADIQAQVQASGQSPTQLYNQLSPDQKAQVNQELGKNQASQTSTSKSSNEGVQAKTSSQSPSGIELMYTKRNNHLSMDTVYLKDKLPSITKPKNRFSFKTQNINQFGYDIFNTRFDPIELTNIPVGPSYKIGPGDEIIIRIWGKLEEKLNLTVDKSGQLFIPKIGLIYINGEKFENLHKIIKKELEKKFANIDLSVSMGRLRTIKVFALGEVNSPGAYDISSLATALLGLNVAGGVKKTGSLRNIILKKSDGTIKNIDLYDYLLSGNPYNDPGLSDYDTLYIPIISETVKINGLVKRPGIFEIDSKTSAYDAISLLAGGITPYAYIKKIQINRVIDQEKTILIDYKFNTLNEMMKQSLNKPNY